jgi:hypothetical protein
MLYQVLDGGQDVHAIVESFREEGQNLLDRAERSGEWQILEGDFNVAGCVGKILAIQKTMAHFRQNNEPLEGSGMMEREHELQQQLMQMARQVTPPGQGQHAASPRPGTSSSTGCGGSGGSGGSRGVRWRSGWVRTAANFLTGDIGNSAAEAEPPLDSEPEAEPAAQPKRRKTLAGQRATGPSFRTRAQTRDTTEHTEPGLTVFPDPPRVPSGSNSTRLKKGAKSSQ